MDNSRIVTPDSFLASMLAEAQAAAQLARGIPSWERPAIQSVDVWLASCWQEVRYGDADVPVLLSPSQELVIWREVIEADNEDLLDAEATAQLARRAAATVAEWHIPLDASEWSDNIDALRFRDWYMRFKRLCSSRRFATRSDLWTLVPEWIANGDYRPGRITFWGFHVHSPAFRNLVGALGALAAIVSNDPVCQSEAAGVTLCENFEQEVEYAARWARAVFEKDSTRSAAVFIPNLLAHRSLVERTFKQVFHPFSALRFDNNRSPVSSAFRIAAAGPLHEQPIVANALLLLELGKRQIALTDAGTILRCPFISGAAAERSERAQADLSLRKGREIEVSLRQMQRASGNCLQLARAFETLTQLNEERPAQQDLPSWSEFIDDLLEAVGWPGDLPLMAAEEEAVECWNSALSTLGTLGMVSGPVSYSSALVHLRRILTGAAIEVGDSASPVQVLDSSAAAGLEFDQSFAVGLSEEMWPSARSPSPLIPLQLQRASTVPCSSPQSVQDEHRRLTAALFSSAPTIAGSYSAGRLSPFAEPYVRVSVGELPYWAGKLPRQSFNSVTLDELTDSLAPRYRMAEDARGGTGIIKSQSLCPFRAFAEYRLNAAFPDDASFGFDNLQRGGFLHKALEFVWQPLGTLAQLLSLSEPDLRSVVNESVSKAIELTAGSQFHQQTTEVERKRVGELLFDWLTAVESARTQPFTVEKMEGERIFELGGLRLRLRIDRIDRLQNGKLVLIDYKSGKPSRNSLEGDRPGEPQLLIYAAALGSEVDGIFFGQLKPRALKAIGFSRERQFPGRGMGGMRDEWDDFLGKSREKVERLAREFVEGQAAVDPAKNACQYCGISPLCRIHESADSGSDLDGEDSN